MYYDLEKYFGHNAASSAEAEHDGCVKASIVGFGAVSVCADAGIKIKLRIHTDADAARGIATRIVFV